MTDYIDKVTIGGTTYDVRDSGARTALETKAEVDGYYEQMTVGNAEQLVATVGVEDKVPYNFRTAGGSADIGDRLVDKLVGGTIAWNQLNALNAVNIPTPSSHPNLSITKNADNSVTISGTSGSAQAYPSLSDVSMAVIASHVYLLTTGNYANDGGVRFYWNDSAKVISAGKTYAFYKNISNPNVANVYVRSIVPANTEVNVTAKIMLFDLTQMFGSTIADYIYGLETATAGAGVAWFRKLFPKPYYAYNAGELMSVQAASHITRGFNAWDEEWEEGFWNTNTGEKGDWDGHVRFKNYMPILPSTTYYKKCPTGSFTWHLYYDANKNYIGNTSISPNSTFTTPNNAYYMTSYTETGYGSVYKDDLCINLSWDGERDGEYEPYTMHEYPLDSSLTLRGIPKLDANNELYYDGDEYDSDGTVTRKYGIVDLGTLTWQYLSDVQQMQTVSLISVLKEIPNNSTISNILCLKYEKRAYNNYVDKCIGQTGGATPRIRIKDSTYTDADTFKSAMSGVYLIYELATPTTESADPYQNPQIVDDFGTEEYVDAGVTATTPTRDVAIPVGHVSQYQANLRAKLEMAPNSPDGDGDYIVRQTNGQNEYVALTFPADELPAAPTENGTYTLKCTVSGSGTTYAWVADT